MDRQPDGIGHNERPRTGRKEMEITSEAERMGGQRMRLGRVGSRVGQERGCRACHGQNVAGVCLGSRPSHGRDWMSVDRSTLNRISRLRQRSRVRQVKP
jgi:hypothetical protein